MEGTKADPRVELLFKWIMFTATITGIAIISGLYPVAGNIPLIIIPSILVLIFSKPVFFERLKLSTLLVMRILVVFAALRILDTQVYVDIVFVMLIVNILEATATDIFRYKRYLNGISGIAVAVGVFALKGAWADGAIVGNFYVVDGATVLITALYVAAYTLWNWIFVTNEFSPSVALMHVGFLAAPLIAALCTLELGVYGGLSVWLLIRANSLSTGGWLQIGAKDWFDKQFYSPNFDKFIQWTKKSSVQVVCMVLNVAMILIAVILAVKSGTFGLDLFS